jgi:hypothetical protein
MSHPTLLDVIGRAQECVAPYHTLKRVTEGSEAVAAELHADRAHLYRALEALRPRVNAFGTETEFRHVIAQIDPASMLHLAVHQLVLANQWDRRVAHILADLDRIDWLTTGKEDSVIDVTELSETMGGGEWEILRSEGVQKLEHPVLHLALEQIASTHRRKWMVKATNDNDDFDGPRVHHTLQAWPQTLEVPLESVAFSRGICTYLR